MILLRLGFMFFVCSACETQSEPCYSEGDLEEGRATINYDDTKLNFNSSWMKTGSSIQLNLEGDDVESMITIRLIESTDGMSMDALEDTYPYTFALGSTQSSSATFYPSFNEGNGNMKTLSEKRERKKFLIPLGIAVKKLANNLC